MIFTRQSIPNLLRALWRWLFGDKRLVTTDEYIERFSACFGCINFEPHSQQCLLCTCYIPLKARFRSETCPDKPPRWKAL